MDGKVQKLCEPVGMLGTLLEEEQTEIILFFPLVGLQASREVKVLYFLDPGQACGRLIIEN